MKRYAIDILNRLMNVLIFLIYPVLAIIALPWVALISLGGMGYTPFREWVDTWDVYSLTSLKDFAGHLFAPLGSNH
jgi:hypothetical protein